MALRLSFLGRGSALNLKEGNTSAYFKTEDTLFLIDCGSTVFSELYKRDLLKRGEDIYIFITHFHADNIGSLPDLIRYEYEELGNTVYLVMPKIQRPNIIHKQRYQKMLFDIIGRMGCKFWTFKIIDDDELNFGEKVFDSVKYEKIRHGTTTPSFSLTFHTDCGNIFYSGDTDDGERIRDVVNDEKTYKTYCEATNRTESKGHMNIFDLADLIPLTGRNAVFLMHFPDDETIKRAEEFGFEIVEID